MRYEAVFEALPEPVFIEDENGLILEANEAGCAAYGYPRDVLVGSSIERLAVPSRFSAEAAARDLLRRHGYRVMAEPDGEAALARLRGSERIDLLLTDVVMPRMSGRELVENLPPERRSIPVLYVSGYTDSALPPRIGNATTAFLAKPYTPGSLTGAVRALLDAAAAQP